MYENSKRNTREYTVNSPAYMPLTFQKGSHQSRDKQIRNIHSVKRSISSLKDKHMIKINATQHSKNNAASENITHIDQQPKISIRNSNGLQRYLSPQVSPTI